jgi:hypothetical protein
MQNKPMPENLKDVLFERPIPGQSLTNSPDDRYPWEQPPEYTSVRDAREKIFLDMLEPERLKGIQNLMMNEISVNAIAEVILTEGFRKGKFNPDMMLNLLEPTMYMLMAIGEKSGIEPIVESDGYDDDEDEEDVQNALKTRNAMIKEGGRFKDARIKQIQPTSVGTDIQQRLEKLDTKKLQESILQKPKVEPRESLLERGK